MKTFLWTSLGALLLLSFSALADTAAVVSGATNYPVGSTQPMTMLSNGKLRINGDFTGNVGPAQVTQTNSSTTIAVGGTFQTIAAASATRQAFEFVNLCSVAGNCTATTNYCYLYVAGAGVASTANAIPIPPGAAYLRSAGVVPIDAIKATCAGNGDKFYLATQ